MSRAAAAAGAARSRGSQLNMCCGFALQMELVGLFNSAFEVSRISRRVEQWMCVLVAAEFFLDGRKPCGFPRQRYRQRNVVLVSVSHQFVQADSLQQARGDTTREPLALNRHKGHTGPEGVASGRMRIVG